jgi:cytochrome P450
MCIGLHFAYMQVKAVMYQLLRQYEFELPAGYELNMQELPIPKPNDGLPLTMRRRAE